MTDAAGVDHEWIGVTTFYFTVIDFFLLLYRNKILLFFVGQASPPCRTETNCIEHMCYLMTIIEN